MLTNSVSLVIKKNNRYYFLYHLCHGINPLNWHLIEVYDGCYYRLLIHKMLNLLVLNVYTKLS